MHKDWYDDEFGNDKEVTCLLYLQADDWDGGGALALTPPNGGPPVEVAPRGGRLVVFLSRLVEHEIRAATGPRSRFALQLWLNRVDEGTAFEDPPLLSRNPFSLDVGHLT